MAAWYAARGLRPRVALPLPGAEDLDEELAGRGWTAREPTEVLAADLAAARRAAPPAGLPPVRMGDAPSDAWIAAYRARAGDGLPPQARAILAGSAPVAFAEVPDRGRRRGDRPGVGRPRLGGPQRRGGRPRAPAPRAGPPRRPRGPRLGRRPRRGPRLRPGACRQCAGPRPLRRAGLRRPSPLPLPRRPLGRGLAAAPEPQAARPGPPLGRPQGRLQTGATVAAEDLGVAARHQLLVDRARGAPDGDLRQQPPEAVLAALGGVGAQGDVGPPRAAGPWPRRPTRRRNTRPSRSRPGARARRRPAAARAPGGRRSWRPGCRRPRPGPPSPRGGRRRRPAEARAPGRCLSRSRRPRPGPAPTRRRGGRSPAGWWQAVPDPCCRLAILFARRGTEPDERTSGDQRVRPDRAERLPRGDATGGRPRHRRGQRHHRHGDPRPPARLRLDLRALSRHGRGPRRPHRRRRQGGPRPRGARPGEPALEGAGRRRGHREHRPLHRPRQGRPPPAGGREQGHHLRAGQGPRPDGLHRRQRRPVRPRAAPRHLERLLHHQLPRAGGQGADGHASASSRDT